MDNIESVNINDDINSKDESTICSNTFNPNEEPNENFDIELLEKVRTLPKKPGVYQYKNSNGKIIYIGKAKDLRNRVRSYFQKGRPVDAKTKAMIAKIADIEVIVVDSEAEAFILEDTLIKKYKPRYNILLRDDKSYPFVRVTNEPFPKVFITRKIIRDGSKYFGPFTELRHIKSLMRTLRAILALRTCNLSLTDENIKNNKFKTCLDFHIKKCDAPCVGLISKEKYDENIKLAIQVLNGKTRNLEKILENEMAELSEKLLFEQAAIVKNRYLILKDYLSNQKIVTTDLIDRDIIGIARLDDVACSLILKIREGKLIGKRHYIITNSKEKADELIIQSTLQTWFLETDFIAKEIILPCIPEQPEFLESWLKHKKKTKVDFIIAKMGDKRKLVNMAAANAEFMLREYLILLSKRDQTIPKPVLALQHDLRLTKPPIRIECFDNSHIQGSDLVSSMVHFFDGKPKKSEYRKFINKYVKQNDDFAAMKETIHRRYSRLIKEKLELPDLIIVDGGKGQLSSAVEVLQELNIFDKTNIIGIAKRLEEVFFPVQSEPLLLPKTSSSLRLIQHLRDEAHRFAITFHRQKRSQRTIQSELNDIKGIGTITAQKLLIHFGSVEIIKNASLDELRVVINVPLSNIIYSYFHKEENNELNNTELE